MAATEAGHRAVFHPLRVSAIDALTDDAVALTFAVPDALRGDYTFTQGQHVTIRTDRTGDDVRRSYSICTPVSSGRLRIGVKQLPGGAFSEGVVAGLQIGDALDVMTPTGHFSTPLDPTSKRRYVCIAAGSGITPILSIVATVLEVEPDAVVTLVYANRTHRSVMFLEEVQDLKDRYPERFQLVHVLSREPHDVELFSGRLHAQKLSRLMETLLPPGDVDEWFLCGPHAMLDELRGELLRAGVAPGSVHAEIFHADSGAALGATAPRRTHDVAGTADGAAEVTIMLDGRSASFPLRPDDVPVLEAALRVRADAPFACRGGVCGTCRAKVLAGSVEMDTNWALEPDEVARGYVLTCQSHPTSPRLVLDYDA